jgi:hypothetical protein
MDNYDHILINRSHKYVLNVLKLNQLHNLLRRGVLLHPFLNEGCRKEKKRYKYHVISLLN